MFGDFWNANEWMGKFPSLLMTEFDQITKPSKYWLNSCYCFMIIFFQSLVPWQGLGLTLIHNKIINSHLNSSNLSISDFSIQAQSLHWIFEQILSSRLVILSIAKHNECWLFHANLESYVHLSWSESPNFVDTFSNLSSIVFKPFVITFKSRHLPYASTISSRKGCRNELSALLSLIYHARLGAG